MLRPAPLTLVIPFCCLCYATTSASTVVFFDSSQIATNVASGVTSDTISSNGFLFTYTRDKLFTGGIGPDPIGRTVRVPWPEGIEAQGVTTPPPGSNSQKAQIFIERVDGHVFDLTSFTAKLLANTAGAGGSIEIMPLLSGEDAFNDPLYFNATGYYGQSFSYDTSPNYLGSTALLKNFDSYIVNLYVDFAFTALVLAGNAVGLPGDFDLDGDVDGNDFLAWQRNPGVGNVADWQSNYGSPLLVARIAAVPEPSAMFLLLLGMLALFVHERLIGLHAPSNAILTRFRWVEAHAGEHPR
ncbi:PEP-CTERM sorting domain-containing protein [Bythopirellula polymerisocia]|uniref:Ice-binding protein C-terminal domain-containing protein n=1 Tax=Bythopirellula polymerisocia TaxID=2528003 RepID=A0A5C6D511_9BACT|nr:PEP-CTERM sorting domain-containing protein [Bythopirellula polymerisocia]TWU30296.1 hypothetical protein Pla144_10820 [Bythopirellula polymerisocia]